MWSTYGRKEGIRDMEPESKESKRPAERLLGQTLENGWKVIGAVGPKGATDTGTEGAFSTG